MLLTLPADICLTRKVFSYPTLSWRAGIAHSCIEGKHRCNASAVLRVKFAFVRPKVSEDRRAFWHSLLGLRTENEVGLSARTKRVRSTCRNETGPQCWQLRPHHLDKQQPADSRARLEVQFLTLEMPKTTALAAHKRGSRESVVMSANGTSGPQSLPGCP